jgi:hypothetical protein
VVSGKQKSSRGHLGHDCTHPECVKTKIKATFNRKYGVDNPNQTAEIQQKVKETMLRKYREENAFKVEGIRKKTRDTLMKSMVLIQLQSQKKFKAKYETWS